ncbi:peptidoglycan D,D-transpeptidase FtsI family protein [Arthrobacter sp. UM1]|uniref:peptidoglycan D,D-transpeptidase FtsI family protein n=1 Tax=Arthrobacter sp. UM1 TaxID=2766776 RepID=UPI001CF61661|nr:penicillin-binding protein 2 [Arthrobacter sp. UM1]MCB4207708.1 penicillin-binding protein 2 [Arthrobacter sp. UM1]
MARGVKLPAAYARASRRRMRTTVAVFLAVMVLIAGRLFYLQVLDPGGNRDKLLAKSMLSQKVPATRGEIQDANGKVLAHSVPRFDIVVDQTMLIDRQGQRITEFERKVDRPGGGEAQEQVSVSQASQEIASILGLQKQQVLRAVTGTRPFAYIFQGATSAQKEKVMKVGMPGVYTDDRYVRQYPMGQVAGSLVGYRNQDQSLAGVELMEDTALEGKDGKRIFEIGRDGIRNPYGANNVTPAVNGENVKLTIDSDLQWYAQQQIAEATSRLNGEWGNATVLDAKTGRIVASADSTSVDPNDIARHKGQFGLQPIGIVDGFEPGSTAKVVTFAAALEKGKISPKTPITTPNRYSVDGEEFKDYEDHPTWHRTAAGVLARSLNTGTVQVAQKLSPQERYDWLRKFGVGQKVGTGFPGEQAGLLRTPDKWDKRQAYTVSFGQGFTQTALHTAQIYQTIANDGVKVTPQLIDSTTGPDGTVHKHEPAPGERVISHNTAQELTHMMENVTVDGSGQTGQLKNYRVASKTGTAQSVGPDGTYDAYTISYAGFAPAENPRFVVVITISRTQEITSTETGPVFGKIMERALTMNNVPPSSSKPSLYPTFSDGTPNEGSLLPH